MRCFSFCVALLGLAGCELTEPYDRIGTWRPTNVADANIAATVVNPADLVRGVDYNPRDASMATMAVERYRLGKVRALPSTTTTDIRSAGGGSPGDAGAAGAPAGGTAQAGQ